ncbi:MAG: cation:proton antiporter [Termitinemataceae bacterium]
MKLKRAILLLLLLGLPLFFVFAEGAGEGDLTHQMTLLVLQLAVLIFAVRLGGELAKKVKLPSVIGELLSGVIIGPYALGAFPLPGLPEGLFNVVNGFAVSPVLYGFATVASIILLFSSGLETDLDMFLSYSVAGGIVGLGGVLGSYIFGAGIGALFTHQSFFSPTSMFLGIMSTATSVGITARILSDKKKMDSPEGVTIIAAAVFDDVLGIILLAIVMGVVAVLTGHQSGTLSPLGIAGIALKAFGLWLGFTALGLVFSKQIARFLKRAGGHHYYPILSLGLALLLAGIFESEGLAMIIGAYIAGISLSKTDIAIMVLDKIKPLYEFLVPLFFAIMGMLVDVHQMLDPRVIGFGLIYTLFAVLAKVIGAGLPSMFLGFNVRGALRIGMGMVPRGEVALIIAGIGLSAGILEPQIFGVAIMMTMLTSIIAPPLLNILLSSNSPGTNKPVKGSTTETFQIELPTNELAELVTSSLLRELEREGFFVQLMSIRDEISHIRKGDIAISLATEGSTITIETAPEDMAFIKAAVYETFVQLDQNFEKFKKAFNPEQLRTEIHVQEGRKDLSFRKIMEQECVTVGLKGTTKEVVIAELIDVLDRAGKVADRNQLLHDIMEREKRMSTGMEHGIALPHARTVAVKCQTLAIGIHKQGVDFQTIDGSQVHIIAMILTPAGDEAPHMQVLASLGAVLGDEHIRGQLVRAQTDEELFDILKR